MSLGNLPTEGDKKNNYTWQYAVLQLLKSIANSFTPITGYALESTLLLVKTALQSGSFYANNSNFVTGDSGAITDAAYHEIIADPGNGFSIYITSVLVTNADDATGTLVTLVDSDGSPIEGATGYAAAAGGGYSITFPTPIKAPESKAVGAQCGTTGATVYVSVVGFKAP